MREKKARTRVGMLLLALAIDRWIGEPPNKAHPVVGMGKLIGALASRSPLGQRRELLYGCFLAGTSILLPTAMSVLGLRLIRLPMGRLLLDAWLLKTCFAYGALEDAVRAVEVRLDAGDLPGAREALQALVSRDRAELGPSLVAAAAIESMAENLSDSFVAPLLAYALAGIPGAIFYRAANTADAMVGYHGRYEYLGKASAKLDDALNLLPARWTALSLLLASGESAGEAWQTGKRDHARTESPNAGWPMATAAGALGISLCKQGHYVLNEGGRQPESGDIRRARLLCRHAAFLSSLLAVALTLAGGRLRPNLRT